MKGVMLILVLALSHIQYRLWVGTGSVKDVLRLKAAIAKEIVDIDVQLGRNRMLSA